ncbi:DUF393 domain-containing protein [Marinospirillum sp. MEB164]|uniref:DUF393 domain-containing protein n=1 Tax=Marinospirillum alkalitolerans TaxID=3123374 RepID=A0ABW8PWA3_9GAMM
MPAAQLYYDASCGLCRREIDHLRPQLEPQVALVDISQADFVPPAGYTLEQLYRRIHFFDGQQMHIGYAASVAYWRAAGLKKTAWLLNLPLIRHVGHLVYELWARWRSRHLRCDL